MVYVDDGKRTRVKVATKHQRRGFSSLQYAYREMFDWRLVAVSLSVLAASILTFTMLGPMGLQDQLSPLQRLVFVASCSAICWPLSHALSSAILFLMRFRPPVQIVLASALGALFVAMPCSAVAYTTYGLFQAQNAPHVSLLEVYRIVAVLVLACSCLVQYVACQRARLRFATNESGRASSPPRSKNTGELTHTGLPSAEPQSWFFDRLPDMMGRDVVYLNVCGHYINVVTTTGSCLILMRFADAMAALGDLGLQVHRSYWVAYRHITGILRRDERTLVRVTGQHELPVSRTHLTAVRSAVPAPKGQRPGT